MGAQKCPPSPNVRSARCELGRSSVHAAFEAPRETRGASLLAATLLAATLEVAERSDQVIERRDELLNWAAAIDEPSDRQRCRMDSRGSQRNTESSALIVLGRRRRRAEARRRDHRRE